jgi:DNA repair protein RadC
MAVGRTFGRRPLSLVSRVVPLPVPGIHEGTGHAPQRKDTPMQTETIILRELTVRYAVKRDGGGQPVAIGRCLAAPKNAALAFMATLRDEPSEVFAMLCLSTKHRVIGYHEVSRGTLDATLVHPREVFKAALLANAAAIIVAHNHPSGDPTPSSDDAARTARLAAAGEMLGVPLLDHIVIGDARYFSFKEAGRLPD